jgi:hypothetical protein
MKNGVFCDVRPCGSCKEALSSSETSVFTRATRRTIPEDAIHKLDFSLPFIPPLLHTSSWRGPYVIETKDNCIVSVMELKYCIHSMHGYASLFLCFRTLLSRAFSLSVS